MKTALHRICEQQANDAFEAHRALMLMEVRSPQLAENPAWTVLRQEAFAQFAMAFDRFLETQQ